MTAEPELVWFDGEWPGGSMPEPELVWDGLAEPSDPFEEPAPSESEPVDEPTERARLVARLGIVNGDALPTGPPPPLYAPPFLVSDGPTVLYGPGDCGKGHVAAWLAGQLTAAGIRVLIVDLEGHPGEWGRRFEAMGIDASTILHVEPLGPTWHGKRGELAVMIDDLAAIVDAFGVGYVIVDSYTLAARRQAGDDAEGPAARYFGVLQRLGPSLTLAHVTKDGERWPHYPYGSAFVHNLARMTWAAEKVVDDDPGPDAPLVVELRNRKSKDRGKAPDQRVTFDFDAFGRITVEVAAVSRPMVERIADALAGQDPLSPAGIAARIVDDAGKVADPATVAARCRHYAVGNGHRAERFARSTGPKGEALWSLA